MPTRYWLALFFLSALMLSGCSSRSAAAGGTGGNCVLASKAHREGALTCQQGTRYRCESGVWNSTFKPC